MTKKTIKGFGEEQSMGWGLPIDQTCPLSTIFPEWLRGCVEEVARPEGFLLGQEMIKVTGKFYKQLRS